MTGVVSTRLPGDLAKDLASVSKITGNKRSDVLRDVISRGLASKRLDLALDAYRKGAVSIGRAAELAKLPISLLLDEMRRAHVLLNYSTEDLADDAAWAKQ